MSSTDWERVDAAFNALTTPTEARPLPASADAKVAIALAHAEERLRAKEPSESTGKAWGDMTTDEQATAFDRAKDEFVADAWIEMYLDGKAVIPEVLLEKWADRLAKAQAVRPHADLPPRDCQTDTQQVRGRPAYVRPWNYGTGNGIERQLAGEPQTGLDYS